MRTFRCVLVIFLAVSFVGCPARSIFPLFAQKDLVFDAKLLGTWTGSDQKNSFAWERSGEKDYKVTVKEIAESGKTGETTTYIVQVGRIGKYMFADSYPSDGHNDHHFIPTHIISKIIYDANGLAFSSLESDRLRELIDQGTLTVSHVTRGSDIILTAPSAELQKVILQLADDEKAFPKPEQLGHKK